MGAQGNDGYENTGEGVSAHMVDFDAAVDERPTAPFSDFATLPVSFSLPPTASNFDARSCGFLVVAFGMPLWVRCRAHDLSAEPPPLPSPNGHKCRLFRYGPRRCLWVPVTDFNGSQATYAITV